MARRSLARRPRGDDEAERDEGRRSERRERTLSEDGVDVREEGVELGAARGHCRVRRRDFLELRILLADAPGEGTLELLGSRRGQGESGCDQKRRDQVLHRWSDDGHLFLLVLERVLSAGATRRDAEEEANRVQCGAGSKLGQYGRESRGARREGGA